MPKPYGISNSLVNFSSLLGQTASLYMQGERFEAFQKQEQRKELSREGILDEFNRISAPFMDSGTAPHQRPARALLDYKRLDEFIRAPGVLEVILSDPTAQANWGNIRAMGSQPFPITHTDGNVVEVRGGLNQLLTTFGSTAGSFPTRDAVIYNDADDSERAALVSGFENFRNTIEFRKMNPADHFLEPLQSGTDITMRAAKRQMEVAGAAKMAGIVSSAQAGAEAIGYKEGSEEYKNFVSAAVTKATLGPSALSGSLSASPQAKVIATKGLRPYYGKDGKTVNEATQSVASLMTGGGTVNKAISDAIYKFTDNKFDVYSAPRKSAVASVVAQDASYLAGTGYNKPVQSINADGEATGDVMWLKTGEYFPNPAQAMSEAETHSTSSRIPEVVMDLPESKRSSMVDRWNETSSSSASDVRSNRMAIYLESKALMRDEDIQSFRNEAEIVAGYREAIEANVSSGSVSKSAYNSSYKEITGRMEKMRDSVTRLYESSTTDPWFQNHYNLELNAIKSILEQAYAMVPADAKREGLARQVTRIDPRVPDSARRPFATAPYVFPEELSSNDPDFIIRPTFTGL